MGPPAIQRPHQLRPREKPIHEGASWSPYLRLRSNDRGSREGPKDHWYAYRTPSSTDQAIHAIFRSPPTESFRGQQPPCHPTRRSCCRVKCHYLKYISYVLNFRLNSTIK